jgi:hypothetical protein
LSALIYRASNLVNLYLSTNKLTGTLDVSKAKSLQTLNINANAVSAVTGLNNCPRINEVYLTNNTFTQATIDSIATDIYTSGAVFGYLFIGGQRDYIDTGSVALVKIRDNRGWNIITL